MMKARLMYLLIVWICYVLSSLAIFIDAGLAIMGIIFFTPLIILILSILYSRRYKFDVIFSIIIGVLFLPLVIYPYNETAFIYSLIYAAVSFVGQTVGFVLRK